MIEIGQTVLSDDIADNFFLCDLQKCKGGCCLEGDLGAPLEKDELPVLEESLAKVRPYLSPEGIGTIDKQGPYLFDEDGEYSTTTINGKECVFAVYDDAGILRCGIENAYAEGKVSFRKPISCHLYPIRITKYDDFYAINYDRWEICRPACELGKAKQVPLYKFLGEALKRKFGEEWYKLLCNNIESS
jgi:hypothetical protein